MSTQAYLYKWTNTTNKKWYVGSRTKEGCHPDDGYICSSKIKSEILTEQKNWVREILAIGNSTYIRNLEANFLVLLDAKNDPLSYNKHNGDGKFTTAGKKDTTETRLKKSVAHTGKHIGVNNNFYGLCTFASRDALFIGYFGGNSFRFYLWLGGNFNC